MQDLFRPLLLTLPASVWLVVKTYQVTGSWFLASLAYPFGGAIALLFFSILLNWWLPAAGDKFK